MQAYNALFLKENSQIKHYLLIMKQITEEKNKHHHTQDSIQSNLLTGIYRGLLIASLATGIR